MHNARLHFDCLMPETAAELMGARINTLSELLIRDGMVADASLEHSKPSDAPEAELRAVYLEQHDELSFDTVHRFSIQVRGAGSLNQVAMLYSKLFTPPAALPKDPAALEQESNFETTSPYPWFLSIA
ncbi:hypothetical protein [Corynebacterium gerontici]|uniref:Uncharacterized protein n=1 Tax=Corynebacterium gerontici TaxID=2079234 RepID=A0A3G6J168_9CORY|nr:hypothetical protein [Corynebacterium gerontici]AZA11717.1 hypothetical protein CGERO_07085 [Corynebacterium gerontici]